MASIYRITVRSIFFLAFFSSVLFLSDKSFAAAPTPGKGEVVRQTQKLQLPFIKNEGQAAENIRFYSKTFGGTVSVTGNGDIVYSLPEAKGADKAIALKETLVGGKVTEIKGEGKAVTSVNYFRGNDKAKWQSNVPAFDVVDFGEVYKGIGLKLKAYGKNVEKLFFVKPGADHSAIKLEMQGAKSMTVSANGELVLETDLGPVKFTKPVAYQEINGKRVEVEVAYNIASELPSFRASGHMYSFKVGAYDKTRELIIDPLLASTYLGGSMDDYANAIAVNQTTGDVYVTGYTVSNIAAGFPIMDSIDYVGGPNDVFVARFNNALTLLLSCTYIGGVSDDKANAILIAGEYVYVAGYTTSNNLAGGVNAYNAGKDAFVSKFNSTLTSPPTSRYIGGAGDDQANALAIDATGNVYVVGDTNSADLPDPKTNAYTVGAGTENDAFVTKLDSSLAITMSTYIGGTDNDSGKAVAVDGGSVYVAGMTLSNNLPSIAAGNSYALLGDAFVTKLSSELAISKSRYIGGSAIEGATAIVISGTDIYIAGQTSSSDLPEDGVASNNGESDGYLSKLPTDLSAPTAFSSIYFGAAGTDKIYTMVLSGGNLYVVGTTDSSDGLATPEAYKGTSAGNTDIVIAKFTTNLVLSAATYLGSPAADSDVRVSIALDSAGDVYVAGYTGSDAFPTIAGVYDAIHNGANDVFVSKLDGSLAAPFITTNPLAPEFGNVGVGSVGAETYLEITAGKALNVSSITITGDASFSLPDGVSGECVVGPPASTSFSLAADATCGLKVKFDPASKGGKTATLRINSNGSDGGILDIALSGTGLQYTLTVQKAGTGTGTATSTDINCGSTCTKDYNPGATVSLLTAAAAADSTFMGWTTSPAGKCTGTGTCSFSITANTTVTATFNDTTAPTAPVVTGTTPTNDTTPTWNWSSGGGGGNGTYRYKLDSSDLTTGATETAATTYTHGTALADGPHTLYVQERDAAGNWSSSGSFAITVDATAPTAPVVAGTTPTNDTTPTWDWSSGGGGNGTYRYKLDSSDLTTGATETTALTYTAGTALANGPHTLYVQERDAVGNWSSSGSLAITVDTTMPSTPVVTGTTPTNDTTPTWSWTAGGGGNGTYRYKLDSSDLTAGATETTELTYTAATALTDGAHTLYVQERSSTGTWSLSGSLAITVDTTAPTAPVVTGTTPTNDTTPTWNWSSGGGGNGTYRYKLDSSDLTTGATETTAVTYTAGTALTDGAHTLYVQERDSAGNWSASGSLAIMVDTTLPSAPVVTGTTPTNDTTPTWNWSSGGGGGNGTYRYKLDSSDLTAGATETTAVTYTAGTALTDGAHTLYVQERDATGNWSASGSLAVTVDTTAPTATASPSGGSYNAAQSVTLSSEGGAVIYYTINGDTPTTGSLTYSSPISITTPGTTSVKFFATDSLGNSGSINTEVYTITTFDVTASVTGEGGSVSCTSPVDGGSDSICAITPDEGYYLATLTDNGTSVTGAVSDDAYTISNVTAGHTVTASFEIITYSITATSDSENGSISCEPEVVAYGADSTCTITQNTGYRLATVLVDGEPQPVEATDSDDTFTYTFEAVFEDHTIEVGFLSNTTKPKISVTPTVLNDFKKVKVGGSSSSRTYTIANRGTADLVINAIEMTEGDSSMFVVETGSGAKACSSLTPVIEKGKSCTIALVFAPTSGGLMTSTLRISSNDISKPVVDINQKGTGLYTLTVTNDYKTLGSVKSVPAGINCGGDCTNDYDNAASIKLTATAKKGSVFTGWSGGECTGTGQCLVAMDGNTTVTASFSKTYAISGTVKKGKSALKGVTITLSAAGMDDKTVITGAKGTYSFSGLLPGDYTITPGMTDYTFSPESIPVTLSVAVQKNQNFAGVKAAP